SFEVRGRFVTPSGRPPGRVRGTLVARRKNSGLTASIGGDDGVFRYKLEAGSTFSVFPQVQGFAFRAYGPFQLSDQAMDLGDLQLETGFSSRLLLQNEAGEPIDGAKIESAWQYQQLRTRRHTVGVPALVGLESNAEGVIEVKHVTDDPVVISIVRPGYEYARREWTFVEDSTLDWKLVPSQPLVGRLVDANGKGIAGVELHLVHRDGVTQTTRDPRYDFFIHLAGGKRYGVPLAVTDDKGHFQVQSLRQDTRYWLMTLHPDYRPTMIEDVSAGGVLTPLELKPPLKISGQLKGDLSKLRQRSGRRILSYRNLLKTPGGNYDAGFDCVVDDQGRFEISQLLAGRVRVMAADQTIEWTVTQSKQDVVIDLDKPVPVVNEDYRPLRIRLNPLAGQPIRGKIQLSWRLPTPPPSGPRFHYENVQAKEVVSWQAPAGSDVWFRGSELVGSFAKPRSLGTVPEGKEPYELSVDLEPAGLVTGTVTEKDGTAVSAYRMDVDRINGRNHSFEIHGVNVGHPEGRFALGPLPQGELFYQAYVQQKGTWRVGKGALFKASPEQSVYHHSIVLPPPVYLTGRIVDSFGQPAAGVPLSLTWSFETTTRSVGARQKTDGKGRFRVGISTESIGGRYHFLIHPQAGSAGHSLRFRADAYDRDQDLGEIRLQPAASISGVVVDADGQPQPNVTVSLMPVDRDNARFQDSLQGKTNDQGEFQIDGVEQIRQRVDVFGKTVVDMTPPFAPVKDKLGNEFWSIEPQDDEMGTAIIVE
ncbi:MAG: carboxypeptidase-like regulatory domain-containing protein, partial [Pirellulales bacterium]|nr:carboxypeptidase-like regulatory domain-containing protein [Pirellulales bacterium]